MQRSKGIYGAGSASASKALESEEELEQEISLSSFSEYPKIIISGESRNLAGDMPDRVKALDALIDGFLAESEAVLPKPNPAYDPEAKQPVAKPSGDKPRKRRG